MNCSGKHAGMLLTCVAAGWPLEDYYRRRSTRCSGGSRRRSRSWPASRPPRSGVDGCGAPVLAISLTGLARAFLRLVDGAPGTPERAVADAMRAHPELVARHRRATTPG